MTRGIKYYSFADPAVGYGLAAIAYVRALHNAGVPVWWVPLLWRDDGPHPWRPNEDVSGLPLMRYAGADAATQDVVALLRATSARPYDTVVIHTMPEHWPPFAEAGKRNVGYTVWETDALPSHWLPLLNLPDRVLVPSRMNRDVFVHGGVTRPVSVVPHIRRHTWMEGSFADGIALRRDLAVPEDHFVFYSINVWDPRKAIADLVSVFSRTFCGEDKVSLVVKTSSAMIGFPREYGLGTGIVERVRTLQDEIAAETQRAPAHIAVLAVDDVAGRVIDALHATGDCFVSLTHGEGWGMGAFDAATLGKPLLIAPFGGPSDYLPDDYFGFIDYTMVPVSGWAEGASFQPPQRWAQPDLADAARKMRRMVTRHAEFLEPAARVAEHIANRYSEPVVVREFIAALDG